MYPWAQTDQDSGIPPKSYHRDLPNALPAVRPSAMRSVFLDTPPVRYAGIECQAGAIQKLREAVEWPLFHPEAFKRLGVRPSKGLLLYRPPGCSLKAAVLARACATVNFVAVKGPKTGLLGFCLQLLSGTSENRREQCVRSLGKPVRHRRLSYSMFVSLRHMVRYCWLVAVVIGRD